jgi:hypothetical protein
MISVNLMQRIRSNRLDSWSFTYSLPLEGDVSKVYKDDQLSLEVDIKKIIKLIILWQDHTSSLPLATTNEHHHQPPFKSNQTIKMQFSIVLTALLSTAALAYPGKPLEARQAAPICLGAEATPQCCAVNVLDLADLNCAPPPTTPTSQAQFRAECAAIGQQAQCCVLPIVSSSEIE